MVLRQQRAQINSWALPMTAGFFTPDCLYASATHRIAQCVDAIIQHEEPWQGLPGFSGFPIVSLAAG
jgi:hypothetical protein